MSKALDFLLPTMQDPGIKSSGPGQCQGRSRRSCPAVSLSFVTAVVNTGFIGKLKLWHFDYMYIFLKSVFFPQEFWFFDEDQESFGLNI